MKHVSSTSEKRGEYYTETIPIDLVIEILSRLSLKSVTRFRCVSKLWDSIILRPYFTELFLTRSLSRPKLLIYFENGSELIFFSSPQTQNPDVNSSLVRANRLMRFDGHCSIFGFASGLVCLTKKYRKSKTVLVICNPSSSTSQSLPLSKIKRISLGETGAFGYDPIEKRFKVFSRTSAYYHHVLTLGTQNPSWRRIECNVPHHHPLHNGICIDGVLYYKALLLGPDRDHVIICFDMKSENFMSFNTPKKIEYVWSHSNLVKYKGKLGVLLLVGFDRDTQGSRSFKLWVLENAEKHEWSKHTYVLLPSWRNLVAETRLHFVGMTGINDIVLSTRFQPDPFCYIFYNIERNSIRRVRIQGMDAFKNWRIHTFIDHVDDLRFTQVFKTF